MTTMQQPIFNLNCTFHRSRDIFIRLGFAIALLFCILVPQIALAESSTTRSSVEHSVIDALQSPKEAASTLPHDLSPWGMFLAADNIVKSVMIGLALASLLTWSVLLSKTIELQSLKRVLRQNLRRINTSHTLADTVHSGDIHEVGRELVEAAEEELHLSSDLLDKETNKEGIKERVAVRLSRIEAASARRMMTGTGLLATIGAVGPFVGLFGTVWGIMNSFIGISKANTTNLAVVAPGIAEALLATALGLVAAIPAVVIYNHFTRQIAGAKALISDCSAGVMCLVSRGLDRGTSLRLVKRKVAE